ncbi:diguanylate cyclase [Gemmatirosa kalamazoonensis]|uniref:Diguanylate cyclase n=1 Tax=Gemmatirosa kalamazoonensis TaxID=861299 RepID=W0RNV3_9BACT|nr:GGDEF and EAL domain-containing protein [Gemmatirosa kalamazoonensis]AHG92030.1 diguanylate cyclase [Gemmatirosa kalamazoonensis]
MSRLPNLTHRYLAVFAIASAATIGGQVLVHAAQARQLGHYALIARWSRERLASERLAGAATLLEQTPVGSAARDGARRTLAAAAAELRDEGTHDTPAALATAPAGVADEVRARFDSLVPVRVRLLADAAALGADAPDAALGHRIVAGQLTLARLLAAARRDVLAGSEAEISALRVQEIALVLAMLAALAVGAVAVVRPASRHADSLVAEVVASREQLARAYATTSHEREFATSLVASVSDGIYAFDDDQRVTEWNPSMERWTGVERRDALGRRLDDFDAEIDWGEHGKPYERAIGGEPTHVHECRGRASRDAEWRFFDAVCVPVRSSDGRIAGGLCTIRDVTERVATVARVVSSEARFRAMFDQAAIGITFIDDDGIIHAVNPAFERLVGWSAAELIGRRASEFSPPEDAIITRGPVAELRAGRRDSVTVEKRFVHREGAQIWCSLTISRFRTNHDDAVTLVGMCYDVTARKELETRLSHQAFHDPLTGLANRARLLDRIHHTLAAPDRLPSNVAIIYVDLDDFKKVNDSLGHAAGDTLLRAVAERLLNATRGSDTVARLGGDEFAILLENVRSDDDVLVVADRVVRAMRAPVTIDGKEIFVGASVGVARGGVGDETERPTADVLLRNADVAMYRAKGAGKGRHVMYERGMQEAALERLELEAALRTAVSGMPTGDELLLHFQPIVELDGERVVGVEALVRWAHPQLGVLPPARFVPLAEETGLIVPLGRWVLREACRHGAGWVGGRRSLDRMRSLTLTVNVSPLQLRDPGFVDDVRDALRDSGFPPHLLLLELTETVFLQEDEGTLETLRALKALGARLAIDDFGTGYASLNYLQQFPLDVLKIDRRFIDAMCRGGSEAALARTIIALGDSLALRTVAEGVARPQQQEQLRALGCEYGQGFLFAHPVPPEEITRMLNEGIGHGAEAA